jgi:hypothetical protein
LGGKYGQMEEKQIIEFLEESSKRLSFEWVEGIAEHSIEIAPKQKLI